MNNQALLLVSLLSISLHSAVFLYLKPNLQSALPSSAIYRPIVGILIDQKSNQRVSASSAAAVETTKDSHNSFKANGYSPITSLKESFEKNKHVGIEFDSKFTGQVPANLNATPKIGWSLNTESISEAQVVTIVLQLKIDKTGELTDFFVLGSTASKEQTDDILRNFRSTSFSPSVRDGEPVPHTMTVEIKVDNLDSVAEQKTEQR